jgi:hypothetical protein
MMQRPVLESKALAEFLRQQVQQLLVERGFLDFLVHEFRNDFRTMLLRTTCLAVPPWQQIHQSSMILQPSQRHPPSVVCCPWISPNALSNSTSRLSTRSLFPLQHHVPNPCRISHLPRFLILLSVYIHPLHSPVWLKRAEQTCQPAIE